MDIASLSDDQVAFLAKCEEDFANRYTDKDDEFTIVMQIGMSPPPIIEPWRVKGPLNQRSDRRDDRKRGYGRRDDDGYKRRRYN